jgi:hypothetical protein
MTPSRLLAFTAAGIVTLLMLAARESGVTARVDQTGMDAAVAKANQAQKEQPAEDIKPKPQSREVPSVMPATPSEAILNDPASRQKYQEAMQGYYAYLTNGYLYRSRVFEWQLLSSRVIFVVVLLLVGAGMYFAAVQFRVAMIRAKRDAAGDGPTKADESLATKLEFSAKGVVVNSSVMGVLILTLSLAFFYLYLAFVYPIENVF